MRSLDAEVVIVGAGPAGSTLAIRMARLGRRVLVLEGARAPGRKACGEGLMPAGAEALDELGLGSALERAMPFEGIRYRLACGTQAEARFPDGARGYGIARDDLDARLLAAARAEPNVEVRLGAWVREVARGSDGVRVRVGDDEVRAAVIVGADGGRSLVRRAAGLDAPAPARGRYGVSLRLRHAPSALDPLVEVFVGPGCELYTTPVAPDVTNVALLVDRAGLASLQGRLEEGVRDALRGAGGRCALLARGERAGQARGLGPLAQGARQAHADRLILVGDAAGALDPITGEGIALALVTARSAAEVLEAALARGDLSARALAPWTRRRAREVRALGALTSMVLRIAEHPAHAARVVRALGRGPGTFERLLGVASGLRPASSLTLRDGVRVLLGV